MNAYLETRYYGSDFPVNLFSSNNNTFLAHWHIDVEMVYVCEGSIRIGINKDCRILTKGEMAIFSSTDIHYYDSSESNSSIIILIFRPELIGSSSGWPDKVSFTPAFIDNNLLVSANISYIIKNIFYNLQKEMECKQPFYELYVRGKISELCALALRHFPTTTISSKGKRQKLPDIERIQHVIKYLENNYNDDISLDHISEVAMLSPYYFSRLFKKFTGTNFKNYLSRIRIEEAENLIKTTEKSIIDISFECGFNCVRTFNRTFKAIKGYPPSKVAKFE